MARYIHRRFSRRSYAALDMVEPPLVAVASLALVTADYDFVVIEGARSKTRQAELVASGDSWTMQSKHLHGRAIDIGVLLDGDITWLPPPYIRVASAFLRAGEQLGVPLTWGGEWQVRDYGHFELPDHYDWRTH